MHPRPLRCCCDDCDQAYSNLQAVAKLSRLLRCLTAHGEHIETFEPTHICTGSAQHPFSAHATAFWRTYTGLTGEPFLANDDQARIGTRQSIDDQLLCLDICLWGVTEL